MTHSKCNTLPIFKELKKQEGILLHYYEDFADLCEDEYFAFVKDYLGNPCFYDDVNIFILLPCISDPPKENEVANIMDIAKEVALYHANYVGTHYQTPGKDDTKKIVGNESHYRLTIAPPIPAILKSESSVERMYDLNGLLSENLKEASKKLTTDGKCYMDPSTLNFVNLGNVLYKLANIPPADNAPEGAIIIKGVLKSSISLPTCPEEFKTQEASTAIKKLIFTKEGQTQEAFLYSLLSTASNAQIADQKEIQDNRSTSDVEINSYPLQVNTKPICSHENKIKINRWMDYVNIKTSKVDSEKEKTHHNGNNRQDAQVAENTCSIKTVKEELLAKTDEVRTATDNNHTIQAKHAAILASYETQLTALRDKVEQVSEDNKKAPSMIMQSFLENLEKRVKITEGQLEKDVNIKRIATLESEIVTLKEKLDGLSTTNHSLNQKIAILTKENKTLAKKS